MKKTLRNLLCILLVFSMTVGTALQAFAEAEVRYVSEIKMAICDSLEDAKKELAGYTVLESDLNKDQGNGAQSVYLGYKTTKDKSKAITDLRLMDMNGGYSFCDYEKALEEMLEDAQKEINSFSDAVKEFQKNYKAGSKNAVYAYNEMNRYKDDDQNVLIGNLFINENVSVEKLQTIFMEGNGSVIMALEELLAIGCADNWLERLAENGKKVYDASAFVLEEYCEPIRAQWETLYKGLVLYGNQLEDENGFDLYDYSAESFEAWCKTEGITEDQINIVLNYGPVYIMLEDTDFKGGTLLDYFMVPLADVDYEYLYPMADAMTKGQIQTMKYIGLQKLMGYAKTDMSLFSEAIKENEKHIQQVVVDAVNETIEDENQKLTVPSENTIVSVYAGVDRSLFDLDSGVALTNDVIRQNNSSEDASAISQAFKNAKKELIVTAAVGGAAILISAATFIAKGIAYKFAGSAITETIGNITVVHTLTKLEAARAIASAKSSFIASGVGLGVTIGLALIAAGAMVLVGYKRYMNPEYKTVPRAIVDQKIEKLYDSYGKEAGEKKYYYAYYAVEDANPDGKHGNYADMNGWKAQQWNVMYYTKDKRAGEPILADTFLVQYGNNSKPSGYTSFSEFGLSVAADINKHAFEEVTGIFLFYKTAESGSASTSLASIFSNGYYALTALAGIVVGAGVTLGICAVVIKKRKKEAPTEA